MTIALVQYSTSSFVNQSLGSGTTTGKVILIAQSQAPGSGTLILNHPAITGATWVSIISNSTNYNSYTQSYYIYEGYNIPNGTTSFTFSISGSLAGSVSSSYFCVAEFSGLSSTSSSLDVKNTAYNGSGPTLTTPSLTPTKSGDLWIGFANGISGLTTGLLTGPTGSWSSLGTTANYYAGGYYISSDSSNYTTSWSAMTFAGTTGAATFSQAPVTTGDFFQFFT